MNVNNAPRTARTVFVSPFIAVLTLAALLFGVFALHSEANALNLQTSGASLSAATDGAVDASTAAAAGLAAPVVASLSAGTPAGILGCALFSMACVLLLVLVAVVFLTRLPAMFRHLLDAGGRLLDVSKVTAVPVPRPSLTALSIRQV